MKYQTLSLGNVNLEEKVERCIVIRDIQLREGTCLRLGKIH